MYPLTIAENNVNKVYESALRIMHQVGQEEDSRNGPVIRLPAPIIMTYRYPRERVLSCPIRRANPFFHLFESLWMLAGRNDVEYVAQFVGRMREYSDDGKSLHGAYGYRWQYPWGNQLLGIVNTLSEDPTSRRAVLQMWSTDPDLWADSKDLPCNTHVYFMLTQRGPRALDMTVCNRSNDLVWGACGANAVHLTFLQEALACALDAKVGWYHQFTNNLHVYTGMPRFKEIWNTVGVPDHYSRAVVPGPMIAEPGVAITALTRSIALWLQRPTPDVNNEFLSTVAYPAWQAWTQRDASLCQAIAAEDWRAAMEQWLRERE